MKNKIDKQKRDQERITCYKTHRNKVGEAILRSALRALASVDAGEMITDILQDKYNLSGVALDKREFDTNVFKVLRAEISAILVQNSILTKNIQDRLLRRMLGQISPLRDNIPTNQINPAVVQRQRIDALEEIIRQESRRHEKTR